MKKLICFMVFVISILNVQSQTKKQVAKLTKIEFIYEGYASQPHYTIVVFCDKTLIFSAVKNNFLLEYEGDIIPYGMDESAKNIRESEIKGIFKSKLKKKDYKEILSLIGQLNVEFLKQTFNSEYLHNPIGKLKVTYENEDVKLIYDSGLVGSETLIKLYEIFENIRKNTNWE